MHRPPLRPSLPYRCQACWLNNNAVLLRRHEQLRLGQVSRLPDALRNGDVNKILLQPLSQSSFLTFSPTLCRRHHGLVDLDILDETCDFEPRRYHQHTAESSGSITSITSTSSIVIQLQTYIIGIHRLEFFDRLSDLGYPGLVWFHKQATGSFHWIYLSLLLCICFF